AHDPILVTDASGSDTQFSTVLPPDMPGFRSDFEQMIEDRSAAADEAAERTGQFDDLATETIARETGRREKEALCKPVRITPFSAYDGSFGGQFQCSSGAQSKQCVFWTGEDPEGQTWTVTLINNGVVDANPTGLSYIPRAQITWGNHGTVSTMIVDVINGQTVTGSGSAVYVDVFMDPAPAGSSAGTMNLGATMGFFSATPTSPPTYTKAVSVVSGS